MNEFEKALNKLALAAPPSNDVMDAVRTLRPFIENAKALLGAFIIVDKLMQEPSEAMIEAARNREESGEPIYGEIFKAMRDQLLKECEE